jgi:O-antigen/teichoic acid export membrane protein
LDVFERFLTFGRQTLIYGLGGAALQLIGLVTVPIFTRAFTQSQYGILETSLAAYAALLVLGDLSLASAAQRSYYDYDVRQGPERRSTLSTALIASLLLALLWSVLTLTFADEISVWQFGSAHYAELVRVVALAIPVTILASFLREVMRLKLMPGAYTASAIITALGSTAFAVTAVLAFDGGIASVLLGLLVGNALAAMFGLAVVYGDLLGRFSLPELRRMLAYALPLIPAAIALWGVNLVDRLLLTRLGGSAAQATAATGQYAVANRYASLLMFVVTAFALAFGPFQLSLWQEDPDLEKQVRTRMLTYLAVILVGAGVLLSLFAREITSVIAPKENTAYQAVGMLCMAVALFGISNLVLFGIGITRRTGYIAIYTIIALALNIALNVLLIPPWGMLGSAFATLVAYGALAVSYYRRSQILYPSPYEPRKTVTTVALGAAAMAVGVIPFESLAVSLAVKTLTALAFASSLWLFGVLDHDDLGGVRAALVRVRSRGRAVSA